MANQSSGRDYFRLSKLLNEYCRIFLSRPSSTVWTIFRSTKGIPLIFQLGWKVDICTFLVICGRLTNSSGRERKTCLKSNKILLRMWEKWRNIVSLCIMDSNQYNDFLMYLETCVVPIGLPIQYKNFLMLLETYVSLFWPFRHCFRVCFIIKHVLVDYYIRLIGLQLKRCPLVLFRGDYMYYFYGCKFWQLWWWWFE
jgi:hypothetical protein